jgi:predicted RNA-binding protein Jag
MPRASLRQLSRQFARKTIDKAEYRRRRAELIEELSAEQDSDMEPTGPITETPTGQEDETTPRNDGH